MCRVSNYALEDSQEGCSVEYPAEQYSLLLLDVFSHQNLASSTLIMLCFLANLLHSNHSILPDPRF